MIDNSNGRALQIARVVRQGRIARGWTQQELADKVGVNKQSVYHWESAKHPPEPENIEHLESILGVDLSPPSLASQALLDAVVESTLARLQTLEPNEGLLMASEVLAFVTNWSSRHDGHNNGGR